MNLPSEHDGAGYERIVLGTVLINGRTAFEQFVEMVPEMLPLHGKTEEVDHGDLWTAICELYDVSVPIDAGTVYDHLCAGEQNSGLAAAIFALQSDAAGPAHFEHYVSGWLEYREKERIRIVANKVAIESASGKTSIELREELERLLTAHEPPQPWAHFSELLPEVIEAMAAGDPDGLPTGFFAMHDLVKVFEPGRLYILAGRPGMGKSALALLWARRWALSGVPVGILSLEMGARENVERILCAEAELNSWAARGPHISDRSKFRLAEARRRLADLPIFIDDTGSKSLTRVVATARQWRDRFEMGVLIVDHIGLIQHPGDTRNEALGEITRALKALSKTLEIPVIALSQLSRALESRTDKRPALPDLRDSGNLEQDADVVIFVYRPAYYDREAPETEAELIVAKNRSGKTGTARLYCEIEIGKFADMETVRAQQ